MVCYSKYVLMDNTTTYGEPRRLPLKGGEAYVYIQYSYVGTCNSEYSSNSYWRYHSNLKKITALGKGLRLFFKTI